MSEARPNIQPSPDADLHRIDPSHQKEHGASEDALTWDSHPANPFNWTRRKKWILMLHGSFVTFIVGINSTSIATPSHKIANQFNVSDTNFPNSFWPICAWTFGAIVLDHRLHQTASWLLYYDESVILSQSIVATGSPSWAAILRLRRG